MALPELKNLGQRVAGDEISLPFQPEAPWPRCVAVDAPRRAPRGGLPHLGSARARTPCRSARLSSDPSACGQRKEEDSRLSPAHQHQISSSAMKTRVTTLSRIERFPRCGRRRSIKGTVRSLFLARPDARCSRTRHRVSCRRVHRRGRVATGSGSPPDESAKLWGAELPRV
jgi:hypothetical protein